MGTPVENSPDFYLGVSSMDNTHQEFLNLIAQLKAADKTLFKSQFEAFLAHTRQHFEHEQKLMSDSGFPAANEHNSEHLRVLAELDAFNRQVQRGSQILARAWINQQALEWFKLHLSTMDSALASHLLSQPNNN